MIYKQFGRTELKVSVLGYGGAVLGISNYLAPEDPAEAHHQATYREAIERAIELGINYFDTAPGYGNGLSERIYGEVLPAYREDVIIATKVTYSGTPDAIRESVENSLRRLRIDCLDVLQFHGGYFSEQEVSDILNGGRLRCLEQLRDAGKVRYIGVTAEVPTGALEQLIATGQFDVLQICYNVINQLACDHSRAPRGIVPFAKRQGMGVVTMRTATSGFLQKLLVRELGDIADAPRVTRMCLKYVLSTPEVDVALVGMRHPDEVERNASLASDEGARYDFQDLHNRFF